MIAVCLGIDKPLVGGRTKINVDGLQRSLNFPQDSNRFVTFYLKFLRKTCLLCECPIGIYMCVCLSNVQFWHNICGAYCGAADFKQKSLNVLLFDGFVKKLFSFWLIDLSVVINILLRWCEPISSILNSLIDSLNKLIENYIITQMFMGPEMYCVSVSTT